MIKFYNFNREIDTNTINDEFIKLAFFSFLLSLITFVIFSI